MAEVPRERTRADEGGVGSDAFRAVLVVLGCVALVFGTLSVLLGADLVVGDQVTSPSVDSELRFFSAWYALAGLLLLRSVRRGDGDGRTIDVVCIFFGIGGCGRVLSMVAEGMPHPLFVILTVIELLIPVVIIPWRRASAARS